MKATELIAALEALVAEHGDSLVLVDGYEGGYDNFSIVREHCVADNSRDSFSGAYGWCHASEPHGLRAIVLERDYGN